MTPSPMDEAIEKLRMAKARVTLLRNHKGSLHEKFTQACVDFEAAQENYTRMLAEFDKLLGEGVL